FGEEQLVTELDGRADLTALDQAGIRLEGRIKVFAVRDLLAVKPAPARPLDHAFAKTAIMRNLVADGVNRHGSKDVFAVHLDGLVEGGFGAGEPLLRTTKQAAVGRGLS